MKVIALTEEKSWFARHSDLPQLALNTITPQVLTKYRVAVICPETLGNIKPFEIIQWKERGYLPNTRLCFGSYKGIHYWNNALEQFVEQWVVHATSEITLSGSKRMTFIPLSFVDNHNEQEGEYLFCGGIKQRDFGLAAAAVAATAFEARFISNALPAIDHPQIKCLRERVPVSIYKQIMGNGWATLVPLKPGLYSHGQSDVVRSLAAGRPVLVTKGASCDDYIIDGVNGYLIPNNLDDWIKAIHKAWEFRKSLTIGARQSSAFLSPAYYNAQIKKMIDSILADIST